MAWTKRLGMIIIGLLIVIQLVPFGRSHTNPPALGAPPWDSPETEALFARACADCHSNETTWPWFSNVAPVSWLTQFHVDEGREHMNVSTWPQGNQKADEAAETVREGEMPTIGFSLIHTDARLSAAETQALISGLEATFGNEHG